MGKAILCDECGLGFNNRMAKSRHMKTEHPGTKVKVVHCNMCGETFTREKERADHWDMHHRNEQKARVGRNIHTLINSNGRIVADTPGRREGIHKVTLPHVLQLKENDCLYKGKVFEDEAREWGKMQELLIENFITFELEEMRLQQGDEEQGNEKKCATITHFITSEDIWEFLDKDKCIKIARCKCNDRCGLDSTDLGKGQDHWHYVVCGNGKQPGKTIKERVKYNMTKARFLNPAKELGPMGRDNFYNNFLRYTDINQPRHAKYLIRYVLMHKCSKMYYKIGKSGYDIQKVTFYSHSDVHGYVPGLEYGIQTGWFQYADNWADLVFSIPDKWLDFDAEDKVKRERELVSE